jgi:hypothetical protein
MRSMTYAFAALAGIAYAAPGAAAVGDFRLPAERTQQAPAPDVQGPVAPDVPASRRAPQATPAPTPAPSASRTAEAAPRAAAPARVEVPAVLQARPAASAGRNVATPAPAPTAAASAAAGVPDSPAAATAPAAPAPRASAPPVAPSPSAEAPAEGSSAWWWLLAAVPALLGVAALAAWRARHSIRQSIGPVAVPQIERPRVGPPRTERQPAPAAPAEPLQIALEPLRLSLTLMNATLAYRLEIANRGTAPLTGLALRADMIAAHASMSREEQLAGPQPGEPQRIGRLEPGETRVVEGEFRLPFPQIVPIRQGSAALLLPLARFRVEADGAQPLVRTFVVGQPGEGNGLQPFRLDQGPRIYPRLAQHAFA